MGRPEETSLPSETKSVSVISLSLVMFCHFNVLYLCIYLCIVVCIYSTDAFVSLHVYGFFLFLFMYCVSVVCLYLKSLLFFEFFFAMILINLLLKFKKHSTH